MACVRDKQFIKLNRSQIVMTEGLRIPPNKYISSKDPRWLQPEFIRVGKFLRTETVDCSKPIPFTDIWEAMTNFRLSEPDPTVHTVKLRVKTDAHHDLLHEEVLNTVERDFHDFTKELHLIESLWYAGQTLALPMSALQQITLDAFDIQERPVSGQKFLVDVHEQLDLLDTSRVHFKHHVYDEIRPGTLILSQCSGYLQQMRILFDIGNQVNSVLLRGDHNEYVLTKISDVEWAISFPLILDPTKDTELPNLSRCDRVQLEINGTFESGRVQTTTLNVLKHVQDMLGLLLYS